MRDISPRCSPSVCQTARETRHERRLGLASHFGLEQRAAIDAHVLAQLEFGVGADVPAEILLRRRRWCGPCLSSCRTPDQDRRRTSRRSDLPRRRDRPRPLASSGAAEHADRGWRRVALASRSDRRRVPRGQRHIAIVAASTPTCPLTTSRRTAAGSRLIGSP